VNADCASLGCDALTSTCASRQCSDHKRDGIETDVDCGGGICPPCLVGQRCESAVIDCASRGCDALSHLCVPDPCFDHAWDGQETYTDCGGPVCAARCGRDTLCNTTSDCQTGLTCWAGICL
jgi:hypothetical protein